MFGPGTLKVLMFTRRIQPYSTVAPQLLNCAANAVAILNRTAQEAWPDRRN
jgi:hypothetical protein